MNVESPSEKILQDIIVKLTLKNAKQKVEIAKLDLEVYNLNEEIVKLEDALGYIAYGEVEFVEGDNNEPCKDQDACLISHFRREAKDALGELSND